MDGPYHKPLLLALCLVLAGCSSPTGERRTFMQRLFGKASDEVPGIMAPQKRVTAIRAMASEAASRGPEAQEQLAQRFAALYPKESDPLIRTELVRASSKFSAPTASALLRTAAKDTDPDVRIAACECLGREKGSEATAALAEVLGSDIDIDVRLTAARALGDRADPAAVAALGSALEDRDAAMQYRVVTSLREVAPQDMGNDVERWRHYVKGETPPPPKSVSITEQIRGMFR